MALIVGGKISEQKLSNKEVIVLISNAEESSGKIKRSEDSSPTFANFESASYSFSKNIQSESPNLELREMERAKTRAQLPPLSTSSATDGIVTRRKSAAVSAYSKPKSRLFEPSYPSPKNLAEKSTEMAAPSGSSPYRNSPTAASPSSRATAIPPKESSKTTPITPRTPLMASPGGEDDEDEIDNEVYTSTNPQDYAKPGKKFKVMVLIEWVAFVCIMAVLISSLTVPRFSNGEIWSLQIWKWCVFILVIFCGRLVTEWCSKLLVFLIENNFVLKRKVLYFVYSLKNSVRFFIWLGLILLSWGLLINRGVKRRRKTTRILNYITRGIVSSLIGATIWMVKTFLIKLLASSFHVKKYFDKIQGSFFHQYVLHRLSGSPLMEFGGSFASSRTSGQLSFKKAQTGKEKEEVIDVDKLHKMKKEKVSAWTMRGLVDVIRTSGLSTICDTIAESVDNEDSVDRKEITSELEAKAAAQRIFYNVAKHGRKFIEEEDLLPFLTKEDVDNVFPLFMGAMETGKIKKSSLRNWVVNVYNERKCLVHSLNDAKTAVDDLNQIASVIVLVVIAIVWLLLMGIATTQILVFISSQLLLIVFVFGNTAKTIFEAIIFVFVMHPFDVGDRCVIDGIQMVVEEMNILTTVFLRYDNEKIFYPNSLLATKPISNFNRSPEMSDSVEFAVDASTSAETLASLKTKIKSYIESKPQHWLPNHSVLIKEIEDVNKLKLVLYVTHTINFQNSGEKSNRRSDLVFELKRIFEELGIKYHLLPQQVYVTFVGSTPPPFALPPRQ